MTNNSAFTNNSTKIPVNETKGSEKDLGLDKVTGYDDSDYLLSLLPVDFDYTNQNSNRLAPFNPIYNMRPISME